ncbi:hypothetical protein [Mycoplasma phocoeninasale]|uniref:hypothetical protein n=1 Tax=Mycoplasma phocoeninasale TaxID=2726117 RepID=UPI001968441B|nr:hypothetical protein [Mycoplasma phocoeninasale]MBN0970980.1 hypothetical protein [Mycoplasma phocoeninasale]
MKENKILSENIDLDTMVYQFDFSKNKDNSKFWSESEAELEEAFIKQLSSQGYQYASNIHNIDDMIENLQAQIEKLNNYKFTDNEWKRLLNEYLLREDETFVDKTEKIQKNYYYKLKKDNDEYINIKELNTQ